MIVLDTNVLTYAVGDEHPLRLPCQRLVQAITDGQVAATTTLAVVREFAYVRSQRRPRREAATLARRYATLLAPLLTSRQGQVGHALDLYERHPQLDAFDAFLAAVVLDEGAEALVSADRAFAAVDGLVHVDPATPALDRLLA